MANTADNGSILMDLKTKITKSRTQLLIRYPFYGSIVLRRNFIEDPTCNTAWTDGVSIGYSPEHVDSLDFDHLVRLWAHEAAHIAQKHHLRRQSRDPQKWNIAADHQINLGQKEDRLLIPGGRPCDPQYAKLSAEQIYARLPDDNGDGTEPDGEVRDYPGKEGQGKPSEAEIKAEEQKLGIELVQAANMAKKRGELPAGMDHLIKTISAPKLDWRHLLRNYMQASARDDHTWRRPNRRFVWQGVYLPSLWSEKIGEVVVAVDTSGSTYDHQSDFVSEVASIARELRPSRLHLLYCDTRVSAETYDDMDELAEFTPKGGGGTSFVPVFDWVQHNGHNPVVLVYLTDMWGEFPAVPPNYPVIWVDCEGNQSAPFGDYVPLG